MNAAPASPQANSKEPTMDTTVPLYRLAHGRAGDKGNRSNLSVIAYRPQDYELLVAQVTEEAVRLWFSWRHPTRVERHLLPNLHAMNFVLDDVLDGGVNGSLNLDTHGKALSFRLLDMPVTPPPDLPAASDNS
jgi:hypothetical protein